MLPVPDYRWLLDREDFTTPQNYIVWRKLVAGVPRWSKLDQA